ncbi:MAG: uroporphyrinogen-III synthase [Rhodospirillales bacterium]|nr:uroporphyrinogen-III synthase [Rhodospirillales bacterium]
MRVLVTRPVEDAEPLVARLLELGIEATAEPLFKVVHKSDVELDLSGVQAVLATSANGIRALAACTENRHVGLLAVGDATAEAARYAGFVNVESAGGDVQALAELASRILRADGGELLHVAGSTVAGDLAARLGEKGFSYRREVLYEARGTSRFSPEAVKAIRDRELDGVLLFSPRTAETFVALARKARLVRACRPLTAYCLSTAVAEKARAIEWKEIAVAKEPNLDSLLALIAIPSLGIRSEMSEPVQEDPRPKKQSEPAESEDTMAEPELPTESTASQAEGESPTPAAAALENEMPRPRPLSRRSVVPAVILWTFLCLAIVGGAVYAARPFWKPYVDAYIQAMQKDPFQDPRLSGLADRLSTLEGLATANQKSNDALVELEQKRAELSQRVGGLVDRVKDLEGALTSVKKMVETTNLPLQAEDARKSLEELSERITRLEESGEVTDLKAGLQQLGAESERISASVADINQRIQGFEESRSTLAGVEDDFRATMVAVENLRDVLRSAAPFADELDALSALAQDGSDLSTAISELAPFVKDGIPTLAALRDRFDGMARGVVSASLRVDGDGWFAGIVNRLTTLVTVRRTDTDESENSVDALVTSAEAAVAEGDLIGAVRYLEKLGGAPAAEASDWLRDAKSRVMAERAMAVLHVHSVSMMNPGEK